MFPKLICSLFSLPRSPPKTESSSVEAAKKSRVVSILGQLGIPFSSHVHPPVPTVEEMMKHLKDVEGTKCKNFFLRDKKGRMFVLTAPHDRKVDIAKVDKVLGTKTLRFAQKEMLRDRLGVEPGSLSPFALANDAKNEISFLVDEELLKDPDQILVLHPLIDTASLGINAEGLKKFVAHTGHDIRTLKLA